MPTYKDFNKETKDLLTKQYINTGSWKLESKIKPDDRTIVLNPAFEHNAKGTNVSVDVDYNVKEYNIKTKTNVATNGNIKPKVTWEQGVHKVEATLNSLSADSDFELTYQGNFKCGAILTEKLTKSGLEKTITYPFGQFAVGASATIVLGKGLQGWNGGVRYENNGILANVSTQALQSYTTSVSLPLAVAGLNFKWAAQVDCGHNKCNVTAGFEVPLACFNLKAKANQAGQVSLAFVRKFADKWTAALTVTSVDGVKFGLNLTRE